MTFEILRAWVFLAAALFLGSLVHEDAAILAGGYLVVERHLPAQLAALSLYAGVVLGDFAIYGLGRLARRSTRLEQLLSRFGGVNAPPWLSQRLFWVVVGCRFTPTVMFPTFAAIGWSRIPFRRFACAVLVSATLYVPPMFLAVLVFGGALVNRLQVWGWPVMTAGVVALYFLRRRAATRSQSGEGEARALVPIHRGMPPLPQDAVRVALSERINPLIFYIPLVAQWIWLGWRYGSQSLPSAANPGIEAGGLLGESKIHCLDLVGPACRRWIAKSAGVETVAGPEGAAESARRVKLAIGELGLDYPLVVKPDIGWRGFGVRRLDRPSDVAAYVADFPLGERLMVQQFVPYDGEAGLFYARRPGESAGRIVSLTFRYYPFVVGDGRSNLRELILRSERTRWKAALHLATHAGRLTLVPADGEVVRLAFVCSNRVGGLYIDGQDWITPAMTARFDEIAGSMPEFWFGRFDLRFASIDRLQQGEDFLIVEINGAGSEEIHMWDPRFTLVEAYRTLFDQQSLMFAIADANRRRGFAPMPLRLLIRCQRRHQRLMKLYPASN